MNKVLAPNSHYFLHLQLSQRNHRSYCHDWYFSRSLVPLSIFEAKSIAERALELVTFSRKGWLAIAKLKPLSLFISLLSMPKKAFDNVKVVSALQ